MKVKKSEILETLKSLPQNIEVEVLIERILFLKNIEEGLSDLEQGRFMTQKTVEKKFGI